MSALPHQSLCAALHPHHSSYRHHWSTISVKDRSEKLCAFGTLMQLKNTPFSMRSQRRKSHYDELKCPAPQCLVILNQITCLVSRSQKLSLTDSHPTQICHSWAGNNSVADSKDELYSLLDEKNMYLINKSFWHQFFFQSPASCCYSASRNTRCEHH